MTKPPRFDLPDLRLFVAVVEAGSVSAGAASIPLALSAASARLKQLEHRFDMQLLQRHSNGVRATETGKIFYDYARRVTLAAADAQATLEALQTNQRQRIRVLSNAVGVNTDLPTLLAQFLSQHAEIDIELRQMASLDILQAIEKGHGEIGIVDSQYQHEHLLSLPFHRDELVVITANDHPLSSHSHCQFADVIQYPMIALPADSSMQKFVERMMINAPSGAHFRAVAPSFSACAQMVVANAGVAIFPRATALRYTKMMAVKVIQLNDMWATRELQLCMRNDVAPLMPSYRLAQFLLAAKHS